MRNHYQRKKIRLQPISSGLAKRLQCLIQIEIVTIECITSIWIEN